MVSDRPCCYFAYGSNLHPLRLGLRTPTAELVAVAELPGHVLRFHKRSDADGSAKADAHGTGEPTHRLPGAVYRLDPADFAALDRVEGLGPGGYELALETVETTAGEALEVFLYRALPSHVVTGWRPFDWYRDLVLRGAEWHGLPAAHREAVAAMPVRRDPDPERRDHHDRLLRGLAAWQPGAGYALP
ncbi:gamma-glutamylcyclotransferase family protein [Sediminicurvatus halobius]|uniref:Gamma-glutamylcyclotransferase n=1 Tax=Sediminicurvatus halobius TaxID=2182432 RepID=A0A2U2MVU5_9GAMM|nr:gamma-glutamylcyclotransferase family protein [Spiribacter halobius]PWG60964.1 gamma-glutamylcyclotransferase [Spiribacter halobius]UEX78667.1 gamma-glutamylcyclotransferase [Spiribacter halobius]